MLNKILGLGSQEVQELTSDPDQVTSYFTHFHSQIIDIDVSYQKVHGLHISEDHHYRGSGLSDSLQELKVYAEARLNRGEATLEERYFLACREISDRQDGNGYSKALSMLKKLRADKGEDSQSMYLEAILHALRNEKKESLKLLRKLDKLQHAPACGVLGVLYENFFFETISVEEKSRLIRIGAEAGLPVACVLYGDALMHKNPVRAREFYVVAWNSNCSTGNNKTKACNSSYKCDDAIKKLSKADFEKLKAASSSSSQPKPPDFPPPAYESQEVMVPVRLVGEELANLIKTISQNAGLLTGAKVNGTSILTSILVLYKYCPNEVQGAALALNKAGVELSEQDKKILAKINDVSLAEFEKERKKYSKNDSDVDNSVSRT